MDNKRNGYFESESLKLKEYCKKKIDFLEGKNETPLTSADEMLAYTLVFNIANEKSMNYEVHLLKLYLTLLDDYLRTKVLPALNKLEGQQLLEEMWVRWEMLQKLVTTLRVIFGYLDKHYIARAKMKRLRVLGFQSFFERVFSRLHSRFVLAVLQQIEAERDKVPIKRELVSNSITLLLELEKESEKPVYREYFEDVFIQHTQEYYRRLSQIWIRQKSCSSYLKDAEDCLGFEGKIVKDYLAGNSWNRLRKCVESELLRQHQSALLNMDSGCMVMLCNNQKDDLIRLYNLYRHIEFALGPIVKIFKDHLCSEGAKVLGDPSSTARDSSNITISNADDDSGKLPLGTSSSSSVLNVGFTASVIRLLNLHDRAISFVENCFNHDKAFRDAVKETFEAYCNRSLGSIGSGTDLLACYNDDLLRQGRKSGHCDESIKIKLDKVSQLLTYLNDKDVFAELYRKLLSRRLLDQRKWNEELEKSFLRRLKDQCGTQSVSKMEGMMRDLEREREQEQKFKEWLLRSGHYQRRERRGGVGGRDDRFQKMDIEEEEREKEKEKEKEGEREREKDEDEKDEENEDENEDENEEDDDLNAYFTTLVPMEEEAGHKRSVGVAASSSSSSSSSSSVSPSSPVIMALSVKVLTMGLWPVFKALPVHLPLPMLHGTQLFEEFYTSCLSSHRRLAWIHSQGYVQINSRFPKYARGEGRGDNDTSGNNNIGNPKELEASTLQAVVLMLFNGPAMEPSVSLAFEDVYRLTHMPPEDTARVLLSLSGPDGVLIKMAKGMSGGGGTDGERDGEGGSNSDMDSSSMKNDNTNMGHVHHQPTTANQTTHAPAQKGGGCHTLIVPGDIFTVNLAFTSRKRKVKLPIPSIDEKKKVIEDVDKDRRHAIDAAIVRIMKTKKVLKHQDIVKEVEMQLSKMFRPDPKQIKKRIEDLVEREYIVRDSNNPESFKYSA